MRNQNSASVNSAANFLTLRSGLLVGALVIASTGASSGASAFDLNDAMVNPTVAFSATQTINSGRNSFSTQLYREGKKMRMDISEEGQNMSIVMRLDEDTNYMLMHEMSMYQEVKTKRIKQYQSNMGIEFTNQKTIGRETVNGYETTKYTADYKDNDGQTGTGTYWITDDQIPVKTVMQIQRRRKVTETSMELSNLKVVDQPDELFEVPATYNSLNLGGLFSNAMQQPRNNQPLSDQEQAEQQTKGTTDQATDDGAQQEEGRGKNVRKALGRLFGGGNG